jgi:CheY-like chemotaxis protein
MAPSLLGNRQATMRVLLVEDNPVSARVLIAALERDGHEAVWVEDGAGGLRVLRANRPVALVVTDVQMPGMDGFAFVEALRALPGGEALPVIVASAFADATTVHRAAALGIRHFVVKPVQPGQLRQKIAELTNRPATVRAAAGAVAR